MKPSGAVLRRLVPAVHVVWGAGATGWNVVRTAALRQCAVGNLTSPLGKNPARARLCDVIANDAKA
jgi:hypothetical protein